MAQNGLFAKLSCEEVPNINGTTDVKFEGSTRPDNSAPGGTTTTIGGTLHPDGTVEGEMTQTDNGHTQIYANTDGFGFQTIPIVDEKKPDSFAEMAKENLAPAAKACKKALSFVPGSEG